MLVAVDQAIPDNKRLGKGGKTTTKVRILYHLKLSFVNGGERRRSESWLVDGGHGCLIRLSIVGTEGSSRFSSAISFSSSFPASKGISVVGDDVVVGVVAGATTGAAVDCAFVLKLAVFFVTPEGDVVIRRDTLRSRFMFIR